MKNNFLSDEIFLPLSTFGHPVFYVLLIAVLLTFNVSLALSLFLALFTVEIICITIKLIYRKDRPIIQSREGLFNKIDANSFPSIHSARIALIAITIATYYQNPLAVICVVVMLGTGYSRIYLKRHYFIDVISGFIIGSIIALIVINIGNI